MPTRDCGFAEAERTFLQELPEHCTALALVADTSLHHPLQLVGGNSPACRWKQLGTLNRYLTFDPIPCNGTEGTKVRHTYNLPLLFLSKLDL